MKASVKWLNRYLSPGDLAPAAAEEILTGTSFPIDSREDLGGGDARLEVEVTSNRGDCLSHLGLAREIAARTGRRLVRPSVPAATGSSTAGKVQDALRLENQVPALCPRFTAQVIRNVKVGPSPAWLAEALESVGQRSINNIVDVTNFINFELGHPCHAFDLARLAGPALIVRMARPGEELTTLDGRKRTLAGDEVVVADAQRAQSLAGVIGGGESEVSASTRDVVLEVATWEPTAVRRAARRHQVRTDASHRFERYVDPRTLGDAAARAAALMVEVSGGQLASGMLDEGRPAEPLRTVELRPDRCRALLGVAIEDERMSRILAALEIEVAPAAGKGGSSTVLRCTIPPFRPDLAREVDLIEEIARLHGFEHIPIHPRMSIEVKHPQESELAVREAAHILTGMGFHETVTFSFVARDHAAAFLPVGASVISVDDERRKHEPVLRPSILPGLLACRRTNQDAGVEIDGGVRLFEIASTFAGREGTGNFISGVDERRRLALLMDVPDVGKGKPGDIDQRQRGLRILRGALESIAAAMSNSELMIEPADDAGKAFDAAAQARISLDGRAIGTIGLVAQEMQRLFDLAVPVVAAELELEVLVAAFPRRSRAGLLPAFPGIERDLSLVVGEDVRWSQLRALVERAQLARLDGVTFVGSYRGRQIGPGRKSLTMRLRFRDPARTLRHEEVDPQIAMLVDLSRRELQAELRA